jgi:hypothetical protein
MSSRQKRETLVPEVQVAILTYESTIKRTLKIHKKTPFSKDFEMVGREKPS